MPFLNVVRLRMSRSAGTYLQLLRHATADGLRHSVVGTVEHIPILPVAADAVGCACAPCMYLGAPVSVSPAAAEMLLLSTARHVLVSGCQASQEARLIET